MEVGWVSSILFLYRVSLKELYSDKFEFLAT